MERCAQTGEPFDFTTVVPIADGQKVRVRTLGEAVRNRKGEITAVRGALQDLTRLVEECSEGQLTERRLQARLDQMTTGIGFLDQSWRFTYVNETGQRYIQNTAQALIGRSLWELYPEAYDTPFGEVYRTAMDRREVASARAYYPPFDAWFEATAFPTDEGIAIQLQDVTEDERNRRELDQHASRLREQAALLDTARAGMTVRTIEHRVLYWNRGAEELYGWTEHDLVDRSIRLLLPSDRDQYDAAMAATLASGHWDGELDMVTKDGRTIVVDCRWQLVPASREAAASIFAVESDITDVRRQEEERYRQQRLESLGTLAGGMAHDLNNVLTPILLAAQMLAQDEADEERTSMLRAIEKGAHRGSELIRQVLDFARGSQGQRRVLDVRDLLEDLVDFCRTGVPKSISVTIAPPAETLPVLADRTQLLQVLMNLATNARDAMPGGGLLEIAAARSEDAAGSGKGEVEIWVSDTGTGMDAATRQRIFEPFFSTKAPGSGTGLGLSTSMAIVHRHGGTIDVDSTPGTGSCFTLRLPIAGSAREGAAPSFLPRPLSRPAGQLVLVVDDEPDVRATVRSLLERNGYRTAEAGDGAAALSRAELRDEAGEEIDLVLMDVMMPVLPGPAAAERLRRSRPGIPVVLMTGFDPGASSLTEAPGEVAALLPKPFTEKELLAAVGRALTSRTVQP